MENILLFIFIINNNIGLIQRNCQLRSNKHYKPIKRNAITPHKVEQQHKSPLAFPKDER